MAERKYYKTTYTFVVLSEDPIPSGTGLEKIAYETDQGEWVRGDLSSKHEEVSREEVEKLLVEVGSDPGFFMLEDEDEDVGKVLELDDGDELLEAIKKNKPS